MAIGSELSGGIENVFVDNCHFDHGDSKARSSINNVTLRDIKVRTVRGTPVFTENVQGFVNRA
jgi:polygalacturonase